MRCLECGEYAFCLTELSQRLKSFIVLSADILNSINKLQQGMLRPEHALLQFIDRIQYVSAQDNEALEALTELCQTEGILTALETAHAFAAAKKWASKNPNKNILIGNSGRGDKDMSTLSKYI